MWNFPGIPCCWRTACLPSPNLEAGGRCNFINGDSPIALHPDFATRQWEAEGCAELVVIGPKLKAARRWIGAMARIVANDKPRHLARVA
jgi:hypothetical protein